MKKRECPSCAMEVDSNSKECPVCGYEFTRGNPVVRWVALILVLLFLLYLIF